MKTLSFTAELNHGQLLLISVDVTPELTIASTTVNEIVPPILPAHILRPRMMKVSDEIRLRKQEWADATLAATPTTGRES